MVSATTLRHGKEFLMIPGPTNIPGEVLRAMHRPALDIYDGPIVDTTERCIAGLQKLFQTETRPYIYAANGHGAWDSALSNTLCKGDKILVLQSGLFATAWGEAAQTPGLEVEILPKDWHSAVDPNALEEALREDKAHSIKAVLVVQVDTATGVWNDIQRLRKAIDAAGHPALFMVDTIASLGCMPFAMDAWGVDVALTGSQKGLMCPPGLSFVAAGPKARAAHAKADLRSNYMDWTYRDGPIEYQKYCGTPPEHLLFAFEAALDLIFEEGLENVWQRHAILAEATRRAIGAWSQTGSMEMMVRDPAAQANSVSVVLAKDWDVAALRQFTREVCGVTIGGTLGEYAGKGFRIGHMGHVNAVMLLGALSAIETGFCKLGIEHGAGGINAAIKYLAETV